MAEINFPRNPANNDTFVVGSKTWIWKESIGAWVIAPPEGLNSLLSNLSTGVIPSADSEYDLGSPTNKWRDLYLSGDTLHLGDLKIKDSGNGNLQVFTDNNGVLEPAKFEVNFTDVTGLEYSESNDGQILGIVEGDLSWITPTDSFSSSDASDITSIDISNWNEAYGWGDHANEGYATTSYVDASTPNFIDGGAPDSVYLPQDSLDGGTPDSEYA